MVLSKNNKIWAIFLSSAGPIVSIFLLVLAATIKYNRQLNSACSQFAHVVRKFGHAQLMMLGDMLHTQKTNENNIFYTVLKVNIYFQAKKNFQTIYQIQLHNT
jgi:hypothetical protein